MKSSAVEKPYAGSKFVPDRATLLKFLRQMLLARRFEERSGQLYGMKKFGGFCHLYIGQEAVGAGCIGAIDPGKDVVVTAYRDHGQAIFAGMDVRGLMAELFGKSTGCSKGKGGSMHFYDASKGFHGGNGIVGAHIPYAAGVALKMDYNREDSVVLCLFGDGAIHQGSFHETLNLVSVWRLPVIYVCENNRYAMGTAIERVSAEIDFYKLGEPYRIPGVLADGMDVIDCHVKTKEAVERARRDRIPTLIEARTYRYKGHSMSDPAAYRTREEVEQFQGSDPILRLKTYLGIPDGEFSVLDEEIKKEVAEAVEFAENSPEPRPEDRFHDLFV